MEEIIEIVVQVMDVLERHEIACFVGGSLASSLHGIPRATQDVDIVADVRPENIDPLVEDLKGEFYIDDGMIRAAIERCSSFNIIHLDTMFKVDVFIPGKDTVSLLEMERRQVFQISGHPRRELVVASPEDVIVHKLHWFKMGGEVSERQWLDVLGVMKVQGKQLDRQYLIGIASLLDVANLLNKALEEAGLER